ncbi:MAG: hypothetical protein R3E94_02125 [Burkholderiaceae bacterium]
MSNRHTWVAQWLALSLLIAFAFFVLYHPAIKVYPYKPVVNERLDWPPLRITGEIIAGFTLQQPLRISRSDLPRKSLEETFCVALLMSNYLDRRNKGQFSVGLSAAGRTEKQTIQARPVEDNALQFVCFNEFTLGDVMQQDASLFIEGVDGRPGSSVTGWLTPATPGAEALLNGQPSGSSLAMRLYVRAEAEAFQRNAYVLMMLAAMAIALLLVAAYHGSRRLK